MKAARFVSCFFDHDSALLTLPTKYGMTLAPHLPYSIDLVPWDFLFHPMKRGMTGKRFVDVAEVKEKTTLAYHKR